MTPLINPTKQGFQLIFRVWIAQFNSPETGGYVDLRVGISETQIAELWATLEHLNIECRKAAMS